MSARSAPISPLTYLQRIRDRVRKQEDEPMTWAHVAFSSLNTAMAYSRYRAEPRLGGLRDQLREQALDKVAADPAVRSLSDADFSEAVRELERYETGRPPAPYMQDRFLRWLSDRPDAGDWTVGVWHRLVREHALSPGHFDGTREWTARDEASGRERAEPDEHWSETLDRMVGLDALRRHVQELGEFLDIEKRRRSLGYRANAFALHQVFVGSPGTGKTTVARILARIYREYGFLSKGHLVEEDRAGLVAPYVGQTEEKTEKAINEALGGVLFIDEAYSLASGGSSDFGARAIDTLVKRMSDRSREFVVIVAGYTDKMEEFIQANPGLRSRFTSRMEFPDYNDEELGRIFRIQAEQGGFTIDEPTVEAARTVLRGLRDARGREFGNAREARTLWEGALRRQAARLRASERGGRSIDGELMRIVAGDVPLNGRGKSAAY